MYINLDYSENFVCVDGTNPEADAIMTGFLWNNETPDWTPDDARVYDTIKAYLGVLYLQTKKPTNMFIYVFLHIIFCVSCSFRSSPIPLWGAVPDPSCITFPTCLTVCWVYVINCSHLAYFLFQNHTISIIVVVFFLFFICSLEAGNHQGLWSKCLPHLAICATLRSPLPTRRGRLGGHAYSC